MSRPFDHRADRRSSLALGPADGVSRDAPADGCVRLDDRLARIIEDGACRRLWRVRRQRRLRRQEPGTPARSAWPYFDFASVFRLAAQYLLIRRPTAFLAAADIPRRFRPGLAPFVTRESWRCLDSSSGSGTAPVGPRNGLH